MLSIIHYRFWANSYIYWIRIKSYTSCHFYISCSSWCISLPGWAFTLQNWYFQGSACFTVFEQLFSVNFSVRSINKLEHNSSKCASKRCSQHNRPYFLQFLLFSGVSQVKSVVSDLICNSLRRVCTQSQSKNLAYCDQTKWNAEPSLEIIFRECRIGGNHY